MLNLLKALRDDDHGVILSTEIVIVGSLLVIGLITGLGCLRQSVNSELQDVANAIGALDQSYSFSGHCKDGNWAGQCCAWTAGSAFVNCETSAQEAGDLAGCQDLSAVIDDCSCGTAIPLHGPCCSDCEEMSCRGACGECGRAAPCGSCSAGVTAGCQSSGVVDVETGVPGVRVSEWRGVSDGFPVRENDCNDCQSAGSAVRGHEDLFRFPEHVWE